MIKIVMKLALFLLPATVQASSSPTPKASLLRLRGGGVFGSPVTKQTLANLYIAEQAVRGSLMLLSPDKAYSVYGSDSATTSFQTFALQAMGGSAVNTAITAYLATCVGGLSAPKIIAYAVIPCAAIMVNGVLTENFVDQGFHKGSATAFAATFLACQYLVFSGHDKATLAAQVLAAVHAVVGITGFLAPEQAAKLNGVDLQGDAKKVYLWQYHYAGPLLGVALMHVLLLRGESGLTAVGASAGINMITSLLALVLGDAAKLTSVPENVFYYYAIAFAAMALGILYG